MKHTAANAHADAPRVFARLPTVIQVTGLGRSTIYRMVASGVVPCTRPGRPARGRLALVRPRPLERIAA